MKIKAAMINKYKQSSLTIKSINLPELNDNEILVQTKAVSINPIDSRVKNGELKLLVHNDMPLILGHDFSGIIVKIGANVKDYKIGDAVYGNSSEKMGTFADHITVNPKDITLKPSNLSFDEAASIPLVSLTAYQALHDIMQIQKGQKVLIQAGSGGVGSIAIQIAKNLGAYVTTTTSAKNINLVRKLGADQVVDYYKENFQDVLFDYDYVFDTLGGHALNESFQIVKPGGKIVSIAGIPDAKFAHENHLAFWKELLFGIATRKINKLENKTHVDYRFLFMQPSGKELKIISQWIDENKLIPIIDKVFPFEHINEAMMHSQSGKAKGKIIVRMD